MDSLKVGAKSISIVLIIGYVAINFVAPLPLFLIVENLVYSVLYATFLVALARRDDVGALGLAALSSFNAGRVSRSIITPRGEITDMALAHMPLFILLLTLLVLSLCLITKRSPR